VSDPVVVRVVSRRPPLITWPCPSCHARRPFACSERFRANSNGKLVDIWLIYRCRDCEATKNITIVERTPVRRIPRPLLVAAESNDAATARRLARDVGVLRGNGAVVADGDDWVLVDASFDAPAVRLVFDEPLLVRLDAVAAAVFGISRRVVSDTVRVDVGGRVDRLRLWSGAVLAR
jgi:hypothetical protein